MHEHIELELAIRSERHAVLVGDGVPLEVKTVLDNSTGEFVFPVNAFSLDARESILWLPEERNNAMQILVELNEIDGSNSEPADRWRIYHGEPTDNNWVSASPQAVRFGSLVADGSDIELSNPLAATEPALCKEFNADRERLGRLATAFDARSQGDGLLVGVDPMGIDIRSRFDIVRLPFGERVVEGAEASSYIHNLLDELAGRV
jgi:hypothetical protein